MEKSHWYEQINWDEKFGLKVFHRLWEYTQDRILYLHWHEHIEIIYQVQGESRYYFEREEVRAQVGDIMVINSKVLHEGFSVKQINRFNEYYAIVFHPSMLKGLVMELDDYRHVVEPYLKGQRLFPQQIRPDNDSYSQILHTVQQIIREYGSKRTGYKLNIASLLMQFCVHCVRNSEFGPSPGARNNSISMYEQYNARFKPLFQYVEKHYHEKTSLDDAARLVNMSRYHFCKVFKRLTGRTFNEYMNSFRVHEAVNLLLQTDLTMMEIAEKAGFSSVQYMYRLFRKYKKDAPAALRNLTGDPYHEA